MLDHLHREFQRRRDSKNFRTLKVGDETLIDFVSNDYLGLARAETLFYAIRERTQTLPHKNGSTGSRLLSGNTAYTDEIETKLAELFKAEATLIFNSGYDANLGVLSSVASKGDTILYDEKSHASIKDGARLSLAKRFSFQHNDVEDLTRKIRRSSGNIFVVIESLYSMDGDFAPLHEIVKVANEFNCTIILDEAHSTGTFGPGGSGFACALGLEKLVDIRIHTFGKAMGIHGACVAGTRTVKDFLINFSRPFIYSTAPDLHTLASIDCAFQLLGSAPNLQADLQEKISAYTFGNEELRSPIHIVSFPGSENALNAANKLRASGFDVRAILAPTVPAGDERLRICLHTFNSTTQIDALKRELLRIQQDE